MRELTIFYDLKCGLCCQVKAWMLRQPAYLKLHFIPFDSPLALEVLPELPQFDPAGQIVVYADTGEVYQGAEAWITCLWALRSWRGWARTLGRPEWKPWAHYLCDLISAKRLRLSQLLRLRPEDVPGVLPCEGGVCRRW